MDGKILDNDDAVEGIVLLRKGAESEATLNGIHAKVKELNEQILPPGVKIVPFLDRSKLVEYTTAHGSAQSDSKASFLSRIILFLFLGNVRGAFIVALTIPFSLLFAAICLKLNNIPANLLSLGRAGFRHGGGRHGGDGGEHRSPPEPSEARATRSTTGTIRESAHEVQRPVFYAIGIIITAYLPIFTLQAVEGRLFKPMAWTVSFALLGALIFAMMIAPALSSFVFGKNTREWRNPVMEWITNAYRATVQIAIRLRWLTVAVAAAALGLSAWLGMSGVIGSEFLPHLDEGAIWARGTLAPSTGPTEGIRLTDQARIIFASFPEVTQVVSQVGRPDDGTDTGGFFNTEYFVDLKPKEQWRPVFRQNKEELIGAMDRELEKLPGVIWNFSQPIADNMEEAVSGVKGRACGQDLRRRSQAARGEGRRDRQCPAQDQRRGGSRAVPRGRAAESEPRGQSRSGGPVRH